MSNKSAATGTGASALERAGVSTGGEGANHGTPHSPSGGESSREERLSAADPPMLLRELSVMADEMLNATLPDQSGTVSPFAGTLRDWHALTRCVYAVLADYERGYQMLEVLGVPRERARNVSNGIDVLATRYRREIGILEAILKQDQTVVSMLNSMVICGEGHSDLSRAAVTKVLGERV